MLAQIKFSNQPLLVQKYGGTSLATPERIKNVASHIASTNRSGVQLVVVVSAMGKTTDDLLTLAHSVSPSPTYREMDMLLSAGERISMALMSMALSDLGLSAVSFTGSQCGIVTTGNHRRARIKAISGDRIKKSLADSKVVIVAGFQGVSEDKEITTLGRGGSDTTAVALAALLGAQCCEIYTDVDGVYSIDPRLSTQARHCAYLDFELMEEWARRGGSVLHPRCVELAAKFGVPIKVRSSMELNQSKPTRETQLGFRHVEGPLVSGITADEDRFLLKLLLPSASAQGSLDQATACALWLNSEIEGKGLEPLNLFISGDLWQGFVEKEFLSDYREIVERCQKLWPDLRSEFFLNQVPVSILGESFNQAGGILKSVVEIWSSLGVRPLFLQVHTRVITISCDESILKDVLLKAHRIWIETPSHSEIR